MRRAALGLALVGVTLGLIALLVARTDRREEEQPPVAVIVPTLAEPTLRADLPVPIVLPRPMPEEAATDLAPAVSGRAARLARSGQPLAVSGVVTDGEGMPLAGADVWFLPQGQLLEAAGYETPHAIPFFGLGRARAVLVDGVALADLPHTVSDDRGAFSIEGPDLVTELTSDPYAAPVVPQLIVAHEGYAVRVQQLGNANERGLVSPELALAPEAALRGRVVNEWGRPVRGAAVRVADMAPKIDQERRTLWHWPSVSIGAWHSTTTDAEGMYRLADLWPGWVDLEVRLPGHARAFRDEIRVEAGAVAELEDFVVERGRSIAGRVFDRAGQPVSGAVVFATAQEVSHSGRGCEISSFEPGDDSLPLELEAELWGDTCRATSDADGRFLIEGLLAPGVTLYARAPGHEATRLRDVAAGSTHVELRLDPERLLDIVVVDKATRAVVRGAVVIGRRVIGERHGTSPLTMTARGQTVRVHGTGRLGTQVEVRAPGYADVRTIVGAQDGPVPTSTIELVPETFLGGRVLDPAGVPIAGARVLLSALGERLPRPSVTRVSAADGSFAFPGLGGGRWSLVASAEGRAPLAIDVVEAQTGERLDAFEMVLFPGAVLEGVVHDVDDADGKIPRHRVKVVPKSPQPGLGKTHLTWSRDDGRFSVANLPAGTYAVEVEDVGTATVVLATGEHKFVRFGASPP